MPGTIFSVNVAAGDVVSAGEEVCVVEAMKMHNALLAPSSGTVKRCVSVCVCVCVCV